MADEQAILTTLQHGSTASDFVSTGTKTSVNACMPEPALADADYEAALAVLHRARSAFEHSRRLISKMSEEEIRDLHLVMLNDHFKGQRRQRMFNSNGRTDILIREQDRHIFITECKLFAPKHKHNVEKVISDALDQLLDNCLTGETPRPRSCCSSKMPT